MTATARLVPCPSCGKPASFSAENRWRPFCSERCRLTDLGGWASEKYRIPDKPAEGEGGSAPDEAEK